MCIAVVCNTGHSLTNEQLLRGWNRNRDGGGFAYVNANDELVINKGYLVYQEFEEAYRKAAEDFSATSPFLVHMRIGTSGFNNSNNTHPFLIQNEGQPDGAMIHNGVLFTPTGEWRGPAEDTYSDTRVVVEALKTVLGLEDVLRAKEGIGRAIGSGNKFAFLYANRETVIVNESSGYWADGIWYSNNSCQVN